MTVQMSYRIVANDASRLLVLSNTKNVRNWNFIAVAKVLSSYGKAGGTNGIISIKSSVY